MSYETAICQTVYKQPPERGGEQESDSGCDMMGMEHFREIFWNLSAERKQQGGMVILSASGHCSDLIL